MVCRIITVVLVFAGSHIIFRLKEAARSGSKQLRCL